MDDIERQLTDPNFISDELSNILEADQSLALSIMERHTHGESFDIDEDTAKAIIAKVSKIQDSDIKKQLILTSLSFESLCHIIPLLLVENNKRLLNLISRKSP